MLRLTLRLLSVVLAVQIGCALCSAQVTSDLTAKLSTTSVQDSEILKLLEITKIQLEAEKEKSKLKDAQLAAKDTQIEAFKGLVAVRDEQITLLRSANQDRTAVNTGDARMLASCELQLQRADNEISRLRNPPFLKRLFSTEMIGGFALGYGAKSLAK